MLELVLVRHGQSEGNVAYRRSLAGDHSLYSGQAVNLTVFLGLFV